MYIEKGAAVAWAVDILVTFPCSSTVGVSDLAQHHLAFFPDDVTVPRPTVVVRQFLEFLALGKGIDCGAKGGRFAWGITGNYTNPARFVELLRPFWIELLGHFSPLPQPDWGGPYYYENVLSS
jgi:hypothetical protein